LQIMCDIPYVSFTPVAPLKNQVRVALTIIHPLLRRKFDIPLYHVGCCDLLLQRLWGCCELSSVCVLSFGLHLYLACNTRRHGTLHTCGRPTRDSLGILDRGSTRSTAPPPRSDQRTRSSEADQSHATPQQGRCMKQSERSTHRRVLPPAGGAPTPKLRLCSKHPQRRSAAGSEVTVNTLTAQASRSSTCMFREHSGNIPGTCRDIQGTFRERLGSVQGRFWEYSRNMQGTFREHSG
jgi:hypothetical protein